MNEFDVFKMFFKTPKDYIEEHRKSRAERRKEKEDPEQYRVEEVKDEEVFDSDQVAKCDDIDSFICCICLLLTKKPYICYSKCSAIICKSCLDGYKDKRCPMCRSEEGFYFSDLHASVQDESISLKCRYKDCEEEIKMSDFTEHLKKCPNAPYRCSSFPACKAIIKRKEVHSHKNECEYMKVRCKYFHSHILLRKDLENHEENVCEFRTMMCIGCKDSFYKGTLPEHIKTCEEYPLECPNCKKKVKRSEFKDHPDTCQKAIIKCIAFEKCQHLSTRDKIEDHQRKCEHVYDYQLSLIHELQETINAKNMVIQELSDELKQKNDKGIFGFFG
ncbi:unnamed protein product [Moneuplotes crassus]|uniref:Uncharacterized protein n=1 Tax=Euplotes crassus TaxID=5936 RepID=A0AAD1XMN2_EUPCR|nr:unnamed protein product [Moneuplotes crassus]